jgi:hypothetical protein
MVNDLSVLGASGGNKICNRKLATKGERGGEEGKRCLAIKR